MPLINLQELKDSRNAFSPKDTGPVEGDDHIEDVQPEIVPMTPAQRTEAVRAYFGRMRLDPTATLHSMGNPHEVVDEDVLLGSTKKIIAHQRGEVDADDRDSLMYQTTHDFGDFLSDKANKDQGGLLRRMLWKVSQKPEEGLKKIPPGYLDAHVQHLFNGTGIPSMPEQINPLDNHYQNQKVTRLGEGALPSIDSASIDLRGVNPSYFGFLDPTLTPESARVGVDTVLARGVKIGPDKLMYQRFFDTKLNKVRWVSSREVAANNRSTSYAYNSGDNFISAITPAGKHEVVPINEVRYVMEHDSKMAADFGNITPGLSGIKGMRYAMGAKFARAVLPLVNREAPFVSVIAEDGYDPIKELGRTVGAIHADKDMKVLSIENGILKGQTPLGEDVEVELYNNFPLARKTFLTNNPVVKPGDTVKAGQLLAGSNFTDDKGNLALGRNFRFMYGSALGNTFEDSVVMSEDAAKKMTSTHMYQHTWDPEEGSTIDRNKFMSLLPNKYPKEMLNKIDENGVIKVGETVMPGQPLLLIHKERIAGAEVLGRYKHAASAMEWEDKVPGVVTDIHKKGNSYNIIVRAEHPFEVGDKIANSFGAKGTVSQILKTSDMPVAEDGIPVDVVMSSMGVLSRTNPQIVTAMSLGRVAEKTGKPITMGQFDGDNVERALTLLVKHGIKDKETVWDPQLNKYVPEVKVGNLYFYKQQQTASSKGKAGSSISYDMDEVPSKSGGHVAKHIGGMELDALLSFPGGSDVLKDMKLVRGQKNDDYWRDIQFGKTPATPRTPFTYNKFESLIKAAGINIQSDGAKSNIFGMTNKQAQTLTGDRELGSSSTYESGSLMPIKGGLFDPDKTGSLERGTHWAYYKTPEPVLNPVMEKAVRSLLGVTGKELQSIMSGEITLGGKTGGDALKYALSKVNLQATMDNAANTIKTKTGAAKDDAIKQFKYTNAMMRQGVRPEEFMMDRIPVLPPAYRPIVRQGDRTAVADANYLYRELHSAMEDSKASANLPAADRQAARLNVYSAYKAVTGIGEPLNEKLQQKQVGGMLQALFGKSSPKLGFVQRKVIGGNMDFSALGVATLNPRLSIDQIGLPVEQAWDLYDKYVVGELIKHNYPATAAVKAVHSKSPDAFKALQEVVKKYPVIMNRAPTLHRNNMHAFDPVLVPGHTIQTPVGIQSGYNLDYDGDTLSLSVPSTQKAINAAREHMFASKNLISPRNEGAQFGLSQDYLAGMHFAARGADHTKKTATFKTVEEVEKAWRDGKIDIDTPVEVR